MSAARPDYSMNSSQRKRRVGMTADVCVIGGGPAGATAARRLAQLGHRVCLVERAAYPNHKVGAALQPNIIPLLDAVGLRERIDAASFVRPVRVVNRWAGDIELIESTNGANGFVVDRARFDQILLDAADEAGVTVLRPARASRPVAGDDGDWDIDVSAGEWTRRVKATFVVDATGKGSAVAGKRERYSPPTLALNAYWRGIRADAAEVVIEAGHDEWFWGATLPDGTFNAMVFLDPARARAAAGRNLESLYRSLLAGTSLFRRCLGGTLAAPVSGCDASSYAEAHPVTTRSIKVGEAGFSIDPLSSQGVQAAITSGLQAAVVVNTILRREADAAAAVRFYRERQKEAVTRHARFAARYYSEVHLRHDGHFWRKRATTEPERTRAQGRETARPDGALRLKLSGEAALVATPCVTGDFVRNVPALVHPGVERPVAYFGGVEASWLLASLPAGGTTAAEIVRAWATCIPPCEGFELVRWLYNVGVLVNDAFD